MVSGLQTSCKTGSLLPIKLCPDSADTPAGRSFVKNMLFDDQHSYRLSYDMPLMLCFVTCNRKLEAIRPLACFCSILTCSNLRLAHLAKIGLTAGCLQDSAGSLKNFLTDKLSCAIQYMDFLVPILFAQCPNACGHAG